MKYKQNFYFVHWENEGCPFLNLYFSSYFLKFHQSICPEDFLGNIFLKNNKLITFFYSIISTSGRYPLTLKLQFPFYIYSEKTKDEKLCYCIFLYISTFLYFNLQICQDYKTLNDIKGKSAIKTNTSSPQKQRQVPLYRSALRIQGQNRVSLIVKCCQIW